MPPMFSILLLLGTVSLALSEPRVCDTEICKQIAVELKGSMDESVDPCDDFSTYICGNFDKTHPFPPGSTTVNSFSTIGDKITTIILDLLEREVITEDPTPQGKAALFYKSCLDMKERNLNSKKVMLKAIQELQKNTDYQDALVRLIRSGITQRLLSFSSQPDSKNPQYFQITIGKPSLIFKEAILKSPEHPNSKKQIESQIKFIDKTLRVMGLWQHEEDSVKDMINLNIKIAQALPSVADRNDPDKYYNKISIKDLQVLCPELSWKRLVNNILHGTGKSFKDSDHVLVFSLTYVEGMCKVLKEYLSSERMKRVLFHDLIWAELTSVLMVSSDDLIDGAYELARDLYGITGKENVQKSCVDLTSSTFVDVVGNMYVKKNFDASKKSDIEDMLKNIRSALKGVIESVNWMDDVTKTKALLKLEKIKEKIGYSEALLDEHQLALDHAEIKISNHSLVQNYYSFKKGEFVKSLKTVNEKIPDTFWFMGPHQVNAYYNPASNEVVFPAAVLQYPFYDIGLPVTSNYGGIGMVIGHEILHGFDTSGSKFDEKGILQNWWTANTKEKYMQKALCIYEQYGNYTIYDEKLPSQQTLGEDIADNAGIRMSYFAMQNSMKEKTTLPGLNFTTEQLFFVQQALSWCSHMNKEALLAKMKADVHTVWNYRIIGPLSNMPEFAKAFNCNHDKKMNRHKKCLVW